MLWQNVVFSRAVFHLRANPRSTINEDVSLYTNCDTIGYSGLLPNSVKTMGLLAAILMAAGKDATGFRPLSRISK